MIHFFKKLVRNIFFYERAFPKHPFGTDPRASRDTYLQFHKEAKQKSYPEIDEFEEAKGHSIDREWFEKLALHTQVVIKQSALNYQHGRILYAALSEYLQNLNRQENEPVTIFETGTARGFSSVVMAKSLVDQGIPGKVVTLDILPHNRPIYWNCIDDHDRPKSRQELLGDWPNELDRVVFIQGWTGKQMERTGLRRIHFAYLDARHTEEDVLAEFRYVSNRQEEGDKIVFDDVTPGAFDGVVRAVERIEEEGRYDVNHIRSSDRRGYAIATRKSRSS